MSQSLSISLTGTTDLPPGKIAAIVTSLEMVAAPPVRPDPPGLDGFALEPIEPGDVERYLAIYRVLGERWMWFSRLVQPVAALEAIGRSDVARYLGIYRVLGERWMWFSRLVSPRAEIEAILADPAVEAFVLRHEGRDVGLLELDFRVSGEAELAFFGLDETVLGRGAGRWLMNRALALAWARPISRFWVHTCTIDHQSALDFYQRSGFTVFKRGIEVDADPRLSGHMPRDSVRHHPVIA